MYLLPASTYFPYQPLCILVHRRSLEAHLSRAFGQQSAEAKLRGFCAFERVSSSGADRILQSPARTAPPFSSLSPILVVEYHSRSTGRETLARYVFRFELHIVILRRTGGTRGRSLKRVGAGQAGPGLP